MKILRVRVRVRVRDIITITGLARSTIYKYVKKDAFPHQIRLGKRAVGWLLPEIEPWIHTRAIERHRR